MTGPTPPARPLALPDVIREWSRGRADRVVCWRSDGSITLTMLLPGETLTARFPSAEEAASALLARAVQWQAVSTVTTLKADIRGGKRRGP
jgi:hypothetical protein